MKLNLGCGFRKKAGHVNVDIQARVEPDLICDVAQGLPFADSTIDEVRAFDFLEHIPLGKTMGVIEEIWRVLKPDGLLEHFTPSTDGRGAFQDPTHLSFWNINSWLYFANDGYRNLYGARANFKVMLLKDVKTGEGIIHTWGKLNAIKQ